MFRGSVSAEHAKVTVLCAHRALSQSGPEEGGTESEEAGSKRRSLVSPKCDARPLKGRSEAPVSGAFGYSSEDKGVRLSTESLLYNSK